MELPNGEETDTRDWASLPGDLLVSVASRFTSLADFFAFRRVCTSWRSNVIPSAHTLSSQSPLIMLHVQNRLLHYHDDEVTDSMSDEDVEYLDRPSFDVVFLDFLHQRFYKSEPGSSWRSFNLLNFSHGYLAVALGSGHIQLRHFFTNDKIWLPKTREPFSYVKNIIFSGNPSSPGCLFGLYSYNEHTIELYQQGESTWKELTLGDRILVMDMVFFERKAYALITTRYCFDFYQLAVIEFTPNLTFKLLGETTKFDERPFLFSYEDELLLSYPRTIFRWDFRGNRWVPKSSFDGWAIFLSKNQLTACINPNPGSWVKPNYRYYYDVSHYALMECPAVHDGSYGSIKYVENYVKKYGGSDCKSWFIGRPVWIFPSVCFSN
ncbi:hypothetical protein FCM35_KLT15576 [Carex littledalei]|uniref:KIB1-4 beta-propeller domain-containing protein n=1 Tax=Carex littledalei TaxID=544730 RepID=A0A833R7W9_9POAL|nr:hypothetical protein FCM35_KLT15576 [Carex littledalei]